ncbi:MAG: hypothetical protein AB7S48_10900 [Bacteroidales bacterium]
MSRKIITIIAILFSLGLILSSCTDSEDKYTNNKSFSYDGTSYALSKGAIIKYVSAEKSGPFKLDLCLASTGINFDSLTGTGDFIYLEMYSTLSTALTSGDYFYAETGETFTFDSAKIYINYNLTTKEGTEIKIVDGTVTISNTGNSYEISLTCKDADGKEISGEYTGALQFYTKTAEEIHNFFSFLDTEYELNKGLIVYNGENNDGAYKLDLYLASSSINFDSFTGTGNFIYFEIISNSRSGIASGNYNYDYSEEVFTFDYATAYIDYDIESENGTEIDVENGTVTIVRNGSYYNITIDCENADGEKITGEYTGTIQFKENLDEDKNFFVYLDKEYELDQGLLVYSGDTTSPDAYRLDLYLATSGIDLQSSTGTGSYIHFRTISSSSTELPSGTYNFDNTRNTFTFDTATIYIDYDIESENGSKTAITSGSLTVTLDEDTGYTITIDCEDENGQKIAGRYSGYIHYIGNTNVKNSFSYLGNEYELSQSFVEYYGENWDGTYQLDLYMASSGINYVEATGSGNILYFSLYTSQANSISSGQYIYDYWAETKFTFDYGDVYINYNIDNEEGTKIPISNGSVTVAIINNIYSITIDCKDESENSITGSYTGEINFYNLKKSANLLRLKK